MIRLARPGDLPGLLDLYQHLNPSDPRLPQALAAKPWDALLRSELIRVVVAERRAELVASCLLILVPNIMRGGQSFAVIENVVTHAAHRRQGLGHAVLAHAMEIAWAADCYKVTLATGTSQESTLAFYATAGLRPVALTHFEARQDASPTRHQSFA